MGQWRLAPLLDSGGTTGLTLDSHRTCTRNCQSPPPPLTKKAKTNAMWSHPPLGQHLLDSAPYKRKRVSERRRALFLGRANAEKQKTTHETVCPNDTGGGGFGA